MQKIYTKTGDAGETGLIGGMRLKKDEPVFWAIGTLDELNALLGASRSEINGIGNSDCGDLIASLDAVQSDLFRIGSEIARIFQEADPESFVGADRTADFEKQIDYWAGLLPELNNFILPGGTRAGAILHQARTVCRRAEREVVSLSSEKNIRPELCAYLNRLGDWLFTAARYVNWLAGEAERNPGL